MSRPNTNYNTKRLELVEIAFNLFMTQGYEYTTINDILKSAKISKGALYHYFVDKEEILDAVLEYIIKIDGKRLDPIVNDKQLGALEKLILLMKKSEMEVPKEIETATSYSKERPISLFDYRAKELSSIRSVEALKKIILEGIESKEFQTDFPEESAEMLYSISQSMGFWILRNPVVDKIHKEIDAYCLFLTDYLKVDVKQAKQLGNALKEEIQKSVV